MLRARDEPVPRRGTGSSLQHRWSAAELNSLGNSRLFLAALMSWQGDQAPSADAIAGHQVIAQGWAHVVTIQKNGERCWEIETSNSTASGGYERSPIAEVAP